MPVARQVGVEPTLPPPVIAAPRPKPAVHFEPTTPRLPTSEEAEQYRVACEGLWAYLRAAGIKSLLLLPTGTGKVEFFGLLGLAKGLQVAGCRRLVLIDTDVNSNQLAQLAAALNRSQALGWSGLLTGQSASQVVQTGDWPGLDVVPAGPPLAWLSPALTLQKARVQITSLTRHYDLVLLLAAKWEANDLPTLLVHATQGTCLVAAKGTGAADPTATGAELLLRQGVSLVGSVLLS